MLDAIVGPINNPRELIEAVEAVVEFLRNDVCTLGDAEQVLVRILDEAAALGLPAELRVEFSTKVAPACLVVGRTVPRSAVQTDNVNDFRIVASVAPHGYEPRLRSELLKLGTALFEKMKPGYGTLLDADPIRLRIDRMLERARQERRRITLLTLDVNDFGDYKEETGEPEANLLLAEIGAWLSERLGKDSVALHLHGDEFAFYFADDDLAEVALRADRVLTAFSQHSFEGGKPEARFRGTLKAVVIPDSEVQRSPRPYDHAAFLALDKPDGKDCIRIYATVPKSLSDTCARDLHLAAVRARAWAVQGDGDPLGRILERWVAERLVSGVGIPELEDTLQQGLRRFGPIGTHDEEALPPMWLAEITLRGILRYGWKTGAPTIAEARLSLTTSGCSPSTLAIALGGTEIVACGALRNDMPDCVVDAGPVWIPAEDGRRIGRHRCSAEDVAPFNPHSSCLLVSVGSLRMETKPFVAAEVYVDPRASSGGGLPDLWQSSLRRIVELSLRNPNISTILLVGALDHAQQTRTQLERLLRGPDDTALWHIADRCELEPARVKRFSEQPYRLLKGAADDLVNLLHQAAFDEAEDTVTIERAAETRVADRPQGIDLGPVREVSHGHNSIRTGTLSEAYPVALQVIRSVAQPFHVDTGERRFAEILGFQATFERPLDAMVPWYWREAEDDLQKYADKVFHRSTGRFGQRFLRREEGDASDANGEGSFHEEDTLVENVYESIRTKVATRRLVISTILPTDARSFDHVGLLTVTVSPRCVGNSWKLHFQWVWRTVEALVGFPFSAYASISKSAAIVERVIERCRALPDIEVRLGEVVYTAQSFHLFDDEGDRAIARAIIASSLR